MTFLHLVHIKEPQPPGIAQHGIHYNFLGIVISAWFIVIIVWNELSLSFEKLSVSFEEERSYFLANFYF